MSSNAWPFTTVVLVIDVVIIIFRAPYGRMLARHVDRAPAAPFGLKDKDPAFWRRFTVAGALGMMTVGVAALLFIP